MIGMFWLGVLVMYLIAGIIIYADYDWDSDWKMYLFCWWIFIFEGFFEQLNEDIKELKNKRR